MHRRTLSRSAARKLTLGAQVLALPLLGGAVAVIGGFVPQLRTPELAPIPTAFDPGDIPDIPSAASVIEPQGELDVEGISRRLAMLGNAPKPAEVVVDDPPDPDQPGTGEPTQSSPLADRLKYLGPMRVGSRALALLSVEGRQRVVEAGRAIPGLIEQDEPVSLVGVYAEAIIVRTTAQQLKIERAAIDRPATASFAPTASTPTPRPPVPHGNPSAPGQRTGKTDQFAKALERRREQLNKTVERGSITQEEADEMYQRYAEREERRRARQEGRSPERE